GRHRADVEVVRGGEAEPDDLSLVEDGHAEAHVRPVRRAVVRRVVDDHVALFEAVTALLEQAEDALHVAGDRPELQRGRKRALADLAALGVEQRDAEVFGFADDRRVRHPGQLVPHLERDAVEGARDHAGRDGIDRFGRRLSPLELDYVYFRRCDRHGFGLLDLDEQIARLQHLGGRAGWDERRRIDLQQDRRSLDLGSDREPGPLIELRYV